MNTDEGRWSAVTVRDGSQDGAFYYAVRTTGVYCRPSCGARLPRRENVSFYESTGAARAAGFRPCKRCRPDEPPRAAREAAWVAQACRMIEGAEEAPTLEHLAARIGLSPHHFHRIFKSVTGVTPKAYALSNRAERVRTALAGPNTVTQAIYEAGFNASSRFYECADRELGMKPARYRAGGTRERIRFAVAQCSLGSILVAATEKGVCAILMGDDPGALAHDLQDRFASAELVGGDADFEHTVAQVIALVEEPARGSALPLDIRGTAFQRRVWQALREIPPGETAGYRDIAVRIGEPKAARAVAQACGANPLAVAIPCHRVVRTDGALSGYRWGVERKRTLLRREGRG